MCLGRRGGVYVSVGGGERWGYVVGGKRGEIDIN